jgi:hypothetical protein
MKLLAIDPGNKESAYVVVDTETKKIADLLCVLINSTLLSLPLFA